MSSENDSQAQVHFRKLLRAVQTRRRDLARPMGIHTNTVTRLTTGKSEASLETILTGLNVIREKERTIRKERRAVEEALRKEFGSVLGILQQAADE